MLSIKTTLIILYTWILIFSINAQEKTIRKSQVPPAVLDSFTKIFPNAIVKRYAKEIEKGKTFYEIESIEGTIHRDLLYGPNGNVAEIEEGIPYDSLPTAIQDTISSKQGKNSFVSAEKETHPGKPLSYGVVLKVNGKKKEMTFNPNGTSVSGSEEMEKSEKESD